MSGDGSKRAVVTGAAGFIGSHLVDRLLAEGWRVTGIDSFEDYYDRGLKEANISQALGSQRYELLEANLLDLDLEEATSEADVVFHLAAQAGVRASWGREFSVYADNNVLATQRLLEAARATGPERLVYASSSSVYGDTSTLPMREDAVCRPFSPYGVTKLAAEHLCGLYFRNFGVPTVSLRFFTVYGPRQRPDMAFNRFIRSVLCREAVRLFDDGSQTRDFTFVDDIVEGLVLAAAGPAGRVFNLGGGSRVTLDHVLEVLGDVTGERFEVVHQPRQSGDVRDTWASIDAAREELGYEPKGSLFDGLLAETEWIRGGSASQERAAG